MFELCVVLFLQESGQELFAGCGDNNVYGWDIESGQTTVSTHLPSCLHLLYSNHHVHIYIYIIKKTKEHKKSIFFYCLTNSYTCRTSGYL